MAPGRVSVAAAALLVLLTACGTGGTAPAPVAVEVGDHGAMPLVLDIPALGVHVVDLQMFGTGTSDGGYACPPRPDVVSWDALRPRPGQPGVARLVASGHGVFGRIADLRPEDTVVVTLSDGRRLAFARGAPIPVDDGSRGASLQLSACGASVAATVYTSLT